MKFSGVKYILTDIEGTTTSVSFVYDILFPYFRMHIGELRKMIADKEVQRAFKQVVELAANLEGKRISSVDDIINTLHRWSLEDRKLTPLKSLQGMLWAKGYQSGEIKGHVYKDVEPALQKWDLDGIQLGVFSSGSVEAQKLIFGFSEAGDLTPFFANYFDTNTGGKREAETYNKIAQELGLDPHEILFLSDIKEELEAAGQSGFQTVQLTRNGMEVSWEKHVADFSQIEVNPKS